MDDNKHEDIKSRNSSSVPIAIVIAGILVAGAILFSNQGGGNKTAQNTGPDSAVAGKLSKKTIAEEVGLNKKAFASCLESGRYAERVEKDVKDAMGAGAQGTPYSVVLDTKTGNTYPIPGALPQNGVETTIQSAISGETDAASQEKIAMRPIDATDHIFGNPNAQVFVIEYSDPECPFCKNFHATMETVMKQYGDDGKVAWVYRHFPLDSLHSKARKESEAFECAGELGGNAKFWEYANKLFEITPSNNQLDPKFL